MNRYRKALGAAVVAALTVVTHGLITGEFNRTELAAALVGLEAAAVAFWLRNWTAHDESAERSPDDDGVTTLGTEV